MVDGQASTRKREHHIAIPYHRLGVDSTPKRPALWVTMLCLAVPVCALDARLAVSTGVGIELISILPV